MMDKEGAKIAQKIYNKLSRIRTERDNYRAVLEGAGYRDLDLLKKETRDCRQIGIEAQKRTQKIIDERNELRESLEWEIAIRRAIDDTLTDYRARLEAVREYVKTHSTVNHISRTEFPSECVDGCPGCEIDEILDPGKGGG